MRSLYIKSLILSKFKQKKAKKDLETIGNKKEKK
jgi:hypothetical protein